MRQLVLVVVLIGAAFAGGALVNGPAMKWVQARLLDYMGLKDGGEIASIDPPRIPDDGPDARRPAAPKAGAAEVASRPAAKETASPPGSPAAPAEEAQGGMANMLGRLAGAMTRPAKEAGAPADAAAGKPASKSSPSPLPIPASVPEPVAGSRAEGREPSASTASAPPGQGASPSGSPPAPLDPDIGVALLASRSPADAAAPGRPADRASTQPLVLELAPSPSGAGGSPSAATEREASASPAAPAGGGDWDGIRRKLQSLGVRRYTIDGEPGGRVSFSCLVPLAGRQAVSQHFEAQGDDEIQAARAVIRRITLWRAARPAPSPSP